MKQRDKDPESKIDKYLGDFENFKSEEFKSIPL
jgi:hypothetical protein